MNDSELDKEYLRTKVIREYAVAISALETLYYRSDMSQKVKQGLKINETRKIASRSDNHRWIIHCLQEHGLRESGVFLNDLMKYINVSRSAAVYILKDLQKAKLIHTTKAKNHQNRMVTCYHANKEMLDTYFDFAVYVYECAKLVKVTEKFNNCRVIDEMIGLKAK